MRRVALLVALASCGCALRDAFESADAAPAPPDAAVPVDAGPDAEPCRVLDDYGTILLLRGSVEDTGGGLIFRGPLGMGAVADRLVVELVEGRGAFTGGLTTADVSLTGPEASWDTCSVCARLEADVDVAGEPAQYLMATSGAVYVGSVTGSLYVRLIDVRFDHVHGTPGEPPTLVDDGCASLMRDVTIDEPLAGGP